MNLHIFIFRLSSIYFSSFFVPILSAIVALQSFHVPQIKACIQPSITPVQLFTKPGDAEARRESLSTVLNELSESLLPRCCLALFFFYLVVKVSCEVICMLPACLMTNDPLIQTNFLLHQP